MSEQQDSTRYVISVLVSDRVGMLRDVTSALTGLGANIDGISQTVVAGFFTLIVTATFEQAPSPAAIRDGIADNFAPDEAAIVVRPWRPVAPAARAAGARYVVTITGRDRKGILRAVTDFLSRKGINIEDWYVEFDGPNVTHVGEITIPLRLDVAQVQAEFEPLLGGLGLVGTLQHDNIFRATNEVGPIRRILEDTPHVPDQ